jgi:hypothetical protein
MGMGMKNTTAMRIRLNVTQPDDSAWNKRDKVYIAVEEVGGEGGGSGNRGKAAQGNIHESIPQGKKSSAAQETGMPRTQTRMENDSELSRQKPRVQRSRSCVWREMMR